MPYFENIALCPEVEEPCKIIGTCGMGSLDSSSSKPSEDLQELLLVQKSAGILGGCPKDNICTKPVNIGGNICNEDAGNPLFKMYPGTSVPKCLLGVASYPGKNARERETCSGGNYFASVPFFNKWIMTNVDFHT